MRYKLSTYVTLKKEQYDEGVDYLMKVDYRRDKYFLINQSIYEFANQFNAYNSLEAVIALYEKNMIDQDYDRTLLVNTLQRFFDQLLKTNVLIAETLTETRVDFEPLYKIGDTIDAFTILDCIADNKSTDVYLVEDSQNTHFIIKMLNDSKVDKPDRYIRYKRELQEENEFLNKFSSKYINRSLGVHVFENHDYLLLAYIKGESLHRYLSHKDVSIEDRVHLVREMVKGFAIMHESHIFHGDVHFGNVLITPDATTKIIDLGFANMIGQGGEQLPETKENKRNGGVNQFIPPERWILTNKGGIKFGKVEHLNAEVYQIGLLCYYAFVEELPFESRTLKTLRLEKLAYEPENDPAFAKANIPTITKQAIGKALSLNPEERFTDAIAMLKYLNTHNT